MRLSLQKYLKHISIFIIPILFLFSQNAFSSLLVFRIHDPHAMYVNLPNAIRTMAAREAEVRAAMAKAGDTSELTVLILGVGDVSGINLESTRDLGDLAFETFSTLAHRPNTKSVLVLGNHEFDFVGSKEERIGNSLFWVQAQSFLKRMQIENAPGRSEGILAANITPTDIGKNIFREFQDYEVTVNGKPEKLRIVGMVLENFLALSGYDTNSSIQLMETYTDANQEKQLVMASLAETAIRQLVRAAREGVRQLIFETHDNFENVEEMAKRVLKFQKENADAFPALKNVEILYFGAAHDHKVLRNEVPIVEDVGEVKISQGPLSATFPITAIHGKKLVVDSGDNFQVGEVFINDAGEATHQHWTVEAQKQYAHYDQLPERELKLIDDINAEVSYIMEMTSKVIGNFQRDIPETKQNLKQGRSVLGTQIAESLVEAGHDILREQYHLPQIGSSYQGKIVKDVLAFQNSTSYRSTSEIAAGNYTEGDMIRGFPFNKPIGFRLYTGQQVLEKFLYIRKYKREKKRIYSPQLPSYLYYDEDQQTLMVRSRGTNSWEPIDKEALYWLVTDDFIASNGMRKKDLEVFLKQALIVVEDTPTTQEVHREHLARKLSKYHDCASVLSLPGFPVAPAPAPAAAPAQDQ